MIGSVIKLRADKLGDRASDGAVAQRCRHAMPAAANDDRAVIPLATWDRLAAADRAAIAAAAGAQGLRLALLAPLATALCG